MLFFQSMPTVKTYGFYTGTESGIPSSHRFLSKVVLITQGAKNREGK